MRSWLKGLGFAALILGSFGIGVITAVLFHLGSPIVTVKLQNASGQKISTVFLEHEHGSLSATNIEPGESRNVRFYAPAETSYKIRVIFADGHAVSGGDRYVEVGYAVTEVITEAAINYDDPLLGYAPEPCGQHGRPPAGLLPGRAHRLPYSLGASTRVL
jgi:hypothetical protein